MKVRRTVVTATVLAAACLGLAIGATVASDEPGLALRLRCWLGPARPACHAFARERENRALEAVEQELRDLQRLPPPVRFDPGPETTVPSPP